VKGGQQVAGMSASKGCSIKCSGEQQSIKEQGEGNRIERHLIRQ